MASPKLTEEAFNRIKGINSRLDALEKERKALLNERRDIRIAPWNIKPGDLVRNTRFGLWTVGEVCRVDEPSSDTGRPWVTVLPRRRNGRLSKVPRRCEHWEKIESAPHMSEAGAMSPQLTSS